MRFKVSCDYFLLVLRIVATPLMKSNIQTMKVKQVQDQLKEMEMKALEQHAPEDTTPDKTLSQTHSPSPVPSEGKCAINYVVIHTVQCKSQKSDSLTI